VAPSSCSRFASFRLVIQSPNLYLSHETDNTFKLSRIAERFKLDKLASLALDDFKRKLSRKTAGTSFQLPLTVFIFVLTEAIT